MALVAHYREEIAPSRADTVSITPRQEAMIGVKYATAQWGTLVDNNRAVARIVLDETKVSYVQTKLDCYIDEILVKTVGSEVHTGQTLLTVYDPDSVPAQQEYLEALISVRQADINGESFEKRAKAKRQLAAAQLRLQLLGFADPQLHTILSAMQPMVKLPIVSPANGVVTDVAARPRQRVVAEALYTIADLSTVWATADLFPSDAASIVVGQTATLRVPVVPGRTYRGVVDSIVPTVDQITHTRKVRVRIDNQGKMLLPGMYGDLELPVRSRRALVVPVAAVLDRGMREAVFVDRGGGYLEPKEVVTGQRTADQIEIVSGLRPGDRVVSSGHFLIDAESHLTYDRPDN
jgi:membrane fusion protein, copper/silver efflux system